MLALTACGADWPQFLGPNRNGSVPDIELADHFPEPFTARWKYAVGAGYAGPTVSAGKVVLFHRLADTERLEALDLHTGQRLWHYDQPATYEGGYNPDNGPRAAPVLAGDDVFAWGAAGRLVCVSLATGQPKWTRDLAREYTAPEGYFGFGCSPLVLDQKVLVLLGGRPQAGIVALDRHTGRTVWTSTEESVSYASPTILSVGQSTWALCLTRLQLIALDPNTGNVAFQYPFGKRGLTVTGATPLVFGDHVFLTASYQIGAELLQLNAGRPQRVWASDEVLSSQYTTPVFVNGYLYGTHGREDSSVPAELRCVEAASGKVCWRRPGTGVAHLLVCGEKLLVVEVQQGDLVLVQANPERYQELDRRHITNDTLRAPPALAEGYLLLRTWAPDARGELLAYRMVAPKR